jgi:ubiquinone/menaquinone biosynthesis C-methylase UbiE
MAGIDSGQRILDVGCGFGGTVASIDGRFENCDLTGINIDRRQLTRAKSTNVGSGNNSITWIEADACCLPIETNSVDTMLAVECAFHFPSRRTFLKEAARVLKPGGRLALSDFTIRPATYVKLVTWFVANGHEIGSFYGGATAGISPRRYATMAAEAGLDVLVDEDITVQTMPTYECLGTFYEEHGWEDAIVENQLLREMARRQFLDYRLFSFERRPRK